MGNRRVKKVRQHANIKALYRIASALRYITAAELGRYIWKRRIMSKYDPLWQNRELERLLSQIRFNFSELTELPPSYFESIRAFEDLSRRFSFPPEYLSLAADIKKSLEISSLSASLPSIYQNNTPYLESFVTIRQKIANSFSSFEKASFIVRNISASINESLAGIEALTKRFSLEAADVAILLRAQDSFNNFASKKLTFNSNATQVFRENTALAISEAARLLPELAYVSELSVLMAPRKLINLINLPPVNLFEELDAEIEMVDFEDTETDIILAVKKSSVTRVVEIGGRVVQRVYEINTEAEHRGRQPVFKPTTKTMMAFHRVPSTVVSDEREFLDIVDELYFLLYEGSGDAKRLAEHFSSERLKALWLLKHLRLGARHDVNHGDTKEISKKLRSVGEAYEALIGVPVPKSKVDWQLAQKTLYEILENMLDDLWFNGSDAMK